MRRALAVPAGGRGKVLVIDDEAMILDLLSILLEGAGFTVATARSAVSLPELVRSEAPDVIVLDVGLRGLRGDRAVHAAGQVPVILYSGECEDELRSLALSSGAHGAVAKSAAPGVLIDEVTRAMSAVRHPTGPTAAGTR